MESNKKIKENPALKKKVPKTLIFQWFQALSIMIFNKKAYRNTLLR